MGAKPANHGRRHYRLLQTWARLACADRPAVAHYENMKAEAYKRRATGRRGPKPESHPVRRRKMVNSRKRRRDRVAHQRWLEQSEAAALVEKHDQDPATE